MASDWLRKVSTNWTGFDVREDVDPGDTKQEVLVERDVTLGNV
jgi:hypothetical protein